MTGVGEHNDGSKVLAASPPLPPFSSKLLALLWKFDVFSNLCEILSNFIFQKKPTKKTNPGLSEFQLDYSPLSPLCGDSEATSECV